MLLITSPIKNIKEVTEPLKEEILNGYVHTVDEMKAWLQNGRFNQEKQWKVFLSVWVNVC